MEDSIMPSIGLCLDSRQLKEIEKCEAGKTYTITVTAMARSKEERASGDGKIRTHVDFDLSNIKIGKAKAYDKPLADIRPSAEVEEDY